MFFRQLVLLIAGCVIACATMALPSRTMVAGDGRAAIGVLGAASPLLALGSLVVGLTVVTGIGILIGRVLSITAGLVVIGIGLATVAWNTSTVRGAILEESSFVSIGVETILWAVVIATIALLLRRMCGEPDHEAGPNPERAHGFRIALAFIATASVPGSVVFLDGSQSKGQVWTAVVIGSILAGLIARMVTVRPVPVILVAMPCLWGGIGHLLGVFIWDQPMESALRASTIPALHAPMPLDYASGSLLGTAIGLGWARSFFVEEFSSE